MLRDVRPDVVSVCTWPQTHAAIVAAAAAEGVKGILCEKPLAMRLSDIEVMGAECRRHGVKLACGHQNRFHPNFVAAARLVGSGALGSIVAVRGQLPGTLGDNGPHLVDTVRFLLGDPPALRVTCHCRRERGRFYHGFPAEDGAIGEIFFEGGIRFEFQTGDSSPALFLIRVEGTTGALEITLQDLKVTGCRSPRVPADQNYRRTQFTEFLRWVKGQRADYLANAEQGSRSTELVLALYESARLRAAVELPLVNRGDVIRQLYPDLESAIDGPPSLEPNSQPACPTPPRGVEDRLAMDGGRRALGAWFTGGPRIGTAEATNLARVLVSRKMNCMEGTMVPALEQAAADLYGSPHAVASTSGTAAIHVALGALNLNPGDEVITTPVTDMGTIIPILAANCIPVFADVDPETGNLTAETIARRITPRTRAVILVHLLGYPADLDPICELLRGRGIPLIEDCAQAHYAEYRGKKVGTFGEFGCFSLQQSKQITCGDGGLTLVNREDLAIRAAMFVDKGWDRPLGDRTYRFLGMNYRMTELQGAVALAQLRRLPGLVRARQDAADGLTRQLREIRGIQVPPQRDGVCPSWWFYTFGIDEDLLGVRLEDFCNALQVEGVVVRLGFMPVTLLTCGFLKNEQPTYGESRYPFSAYPYESPDERDFTGCREFSRRAAIFWSHNVRPQHVTGIAMAVRKVAALLPRSPDAGRRRPVLLEGAPAASR
jgi:dTDP-4-amino-4,6-dideoxygalactose transaminase/predicted dehydrogenase